jgi:hypothetical protein
MRVSHEPRTTDLGLVEPAHAIEILCAACGYDLDAAELLADTCSDCGNILNLRQHVSIQVTTMPAASGGTLP